MTGVTVNDLTVSFDDVTALDAVSLSIDEGEFFTLVGPSGCGKTTLLRSVAGFETPAAGTIVLDGDMAGVPPEERNVGIVFQDYALFPHMTVRENVAYGLRYREPPGDTEPDERVAELLELVDMADLADRDPTELSGGQQQRVALARALAPGPDVLLLDEPLSALDARLRERLRVVIREIQQALSITTIYVTHDQAEALAISDRVAVIESGHVEQVGPPEKIYRNPATRFVAAFVGDNNLLTAQVRCAEPPTVTLPGVPAPFTVPTLPAGESEVTLAVRPEVVTIGAESAPVTLEATVETTEFMGEAYRIHCDWQGQTLLVRSANGFQPGASVVLGFDPADVSVPEAK